MFVNLNTRTQSNFINVQRINQSYRQTENTKNTSEKQERKDIATISPKGKAMSMLETLMKQKQNLIDNKNQLISKTLEKGDSLENIKTQIQSYDEQLKMLEEQISKAMTEQTEKQEKDEKTNKPRTKEEVEQEKLNHMITLSTDLSKTQTISSVKNKMEGQSRVWDREIKADGIHASEGKISDSLKLKVKGNNLSEELGSAMGDTLDHANLKEEPIVMEEDSISNIQ